MVLCFCSVTSTAQRRPPAFQSGRVCQRPLSDECRLEPLPTPINSVVVFEQVWEPRSWQEYCGIAFCLKSRQAFPAMVFATVGASAGCASQTNNNENSPVTWKNETRCQAMLERRRAFTRDDGRTESALLHCPHCTYTLCSNRTQGRVSGGDAVNVFWFPLREWGYSLYQIILKQQSRRPECCGCAWESDES